MSYKERNFELYFPFIAEKAVEVSEGKWYELIIKTSDGEVLSYDDIDRTIRALPADISDIDESECKYEFGYRLRKMMLTRGVNQSELSSRTGISQPALSNYISGKVSPTLFTLYKIAKALECSIDDFTF